MRDQQASSATRLAETIAPVHAANEELEAARNGVQECQAEEKRLLEAVTSRERDLEQKRAASDDARRREEEQRERQVEIEQRLGVLEETQREHQEGVERRRAEVKALVLKLDEATAERRDRTRAAEEQSGLVSQIQRDAAAALFKGSKDASQIEARLREELELEQKLRADAEAQDARVRALSAEVEESERVIRESEAVVAEAAGEIDTERAELKRIEADLPPAALRLYESGIRASGWRPHRRCPALEVLCGCTTAHAYIGARGAAQEVVGAIDAAAHSLPGRPNGRQAKRGARRARGPPSGRALTVTPGGQAAWVSSSRRMWKARFPILRATVRVAGFAPARPCACRYSSWSGLFLRQAC
jgi:hypothetical protein